MDYKIDFVRFLNALNISEQLSYCYLIKEELNNILIETDDIIEINDNREQICLRDYFFLSFLIKYKPEIISFSYKKGFIEKINEAKNRTDKIFRKLIFYKIILDLIDNMKELTDNEDQNIIDSLDYIEKEYNSFIEKNIDIFENYDLSLNLSDIEGKNIDEIYSEIIYGLIRTLKFDDKDYEKAEDILCNQLEIESINLTEKMRAQFPRLLNYDDNYVKQFIISKLADLYNIKKINFNYFLIKFILKEKIYIFEIPFFLNTEAYIRKIPNLKQKLLTKRFDDIIIKKRMEYILKTISCEFYIEYFETISENLTMILNYYKLTNDNNINNDRIIKIKEIIENKEGDYEAFLGDYNNAYKLNEIENKLKENNINKSDDLCKYFLNNYNLFKNGVQICYYLYLLNKLFENSTFELNLFEKPFKYKIIEITNIKEKISYENLFEMKKNPKIKIHTSIINNLEKLLEFLDEIKNRVEEKEKIFKFNFKLILNIKKESQKTNDSIYNLSCDYSLADNQSLKVTEENILINKGKNFNLFLEKYINYKEKKNESNIKIENMKIIGRYEEKKINKIYFDNEYRIIIGITFIPKEKIYGYSNDNMFLIKISDSSKDGNILEVTDSFFSSKIEKTNLIGLIDYILALKGESSDYSDDKINNSFSYSFDNMNSIELKGLQNLFNSETFLFLLYNENKFIIFNEDEVFQCHKDIILNNFKEINEKKEIIINKRYEGGIIRNKRELIALKRGEINKEQDQIFFYDIETKKEIRASFKYPNEFKFNNASLFFIDNTYLCSSVKKTDNNEYGIAFINVEKDEEIKFKQFNFKINCFCPLLLNDRNLFFVGGEKDNEGKIALVEIESNINKDVGIINLLFENMKLNPINHLVYSNTNNILLIACSDGNIYKTAIPSSFFV